MIDSIRIRGFKKIKDISLNKLSSINYLVGPNGCGKSSIIESIIMVGRYGEHNPNLYNRITPLLGSQKDLFANNASIDFYGSNSNTTNIVNSYTFNRSGTSIISRTSNANLAIITRGFILTNLREIFAFNETLDSSFNYSLCDVIRFNPDIIDPLLRDNVLGFLNDYFFKDKKILRIYRSIDSDSSIQLEIEGPEIINLKALSSGQLSLLGLYFSLYSSIETLVKISNGEYLILLDEPENSLHPDLHKEVNGILMRIVNEISANFNTTLQFIVSTHSPFVISSLKKGDQSKTYLINNGTTVNLKNIAGREDGYNGDMSLGVASSLLGAGLKDLVPERRVPLSDSNKLRIIYCESASISDPDSKYYNLIFPEYQGIKNHFISVGGGVDVVMQHFIGRDLSILLGGDNIITYGLVDRSNSSPGFRIGNHDIKTNGDDIFDNEIRDAFHNEYTFIKMLNRREIENYLYDPEILKLHGIDLTPTDLINLDFETGEVKNKIRNIQQLSGLSKTELAKLIIPGTKIYDELANCIFGPFPVNISGVATV